MTLTIDLKLKLNVQPVIIFASTLAYHILHMDECVAYIYDPDTTLTYEAGQDRLCSLAQAYQVCNMGVSPNDNM